MNRHKLSILTIATLLLTTLPLSTAFAEYPTQPEQPITKPSKPDVSHILSITFSPLHLINPVLEITAEYKIMPQIGVALIGAYGSQTVEMNKKDYKFPVWEIGAQGRFYALGDFSHGMQVGAEALYLNVSEKSYTDGFYEIYAYGSRFELGAFIGYKVATNTGFTFEAQGGAKYAMVMDGVRASSNARPADPDIDTISPLININLGWSF